MCVTIVRCQIPSYEHHPIRMTLQNPSNHFSTRTWPPPQLWLRPESPGVVPRSSTCAPLLQPRRVVPNPVPDDAGASGGSTLQQLLSARHTVLRWKYLILLNHLNGFGLSQPVSASQLRAPPWRLGSPPRPLQAMAPPPWQLVSLVKDKPTSNHLESRIIEYLSWILWFPKSLSFHLKGIEFCSESAFKAVLASSAPTFTFKCGKRTRGPRGRRKRGKRKPRFSLTPWIMPPSFHRLLSNSSQTFATSGHPKRDRPGEKRYVPSPLHCPNRPNSLRCEGSAKCRKIWLMKNGKLDTHR